MANNISVLSIAFVLLWMVCITTQESQQQARCDRLVKKLKRGSCEYESSSSSQIPGTFRNIYFWSRHSKTVTCRIIITNEVQPSKRHMKPNFLKDYKHKLN